jgi:hypothetical protein
MQVPLKIHQSDSTLKRALKASLLVLYALLLCVVIVVPFFLSVHTMYLYAEWVYIDARFPIVSQTLENAYDSYRFACRECHGANCTGCTDASWPSQMRQVHFRARHKEQWPPAAPLWLQYPPEARSEFWELLKAANEAAVILFWAMLMVLSVATLTESALRLADGVIFPATIAVLWIGQHVFRKIVLEQRFQLMKQAYDRARDAYPFACEHCYRSICNNCTSGARALNLILTGYNSSISKQELSHPIPPWLSPLQPSQETDIVHDAIEVLLPFVNAIIVVATWTGVLYMSIGLVAVALHQGVSCTCTRCLTMQRQLVPREAATNQQA